MGLLDQVLGNVLGGSQGRSNANSPILMALMALLSQGGASGLGGMLSGGNRSGGGLGGLLESLTRSGHGDIADSWVRRGPNRSIAPDQLEQALDGNTIEELSRRTGMPRGDLLSQLSAYLPDAVDRLTPHGRVPDENDMRGW